MRPGESNIPGAVIILILLAIIVTTGLLMPEPVIGLINRAAAILY